MQPTLTPPDCDLRTPTGPAGRALLAITTAALIGLGVGGCGDDEPAPLAVLPITADVTIPGDVSADPLVFFERVAAVEDTVTLRVMLRTVMNTYDIDVIDLDIRFDPRYVQMVSQIEGITTPLGTCNGPASCDPNCLSNGDVNTRGELILGMSLKQGCPSISVNTASMPNGAIPILTLGFRGATIGSSPIEILYDPNPLVTGDCEILKSEPGPTLFTEHPIPCDDGGATLTATR